RLCHAPSSPTRRSSDLVVQALNLMAVLNPNIRHVAIDGALFQDEVESRQVMSVPSIYLNGEVFGQGRMDVPQILAKLDTGAASRDRKSTRLNSSHVKIA